MKTINIPNSVTSIGKAAFYGCSSLTSITIPYGIKSLEANLFYNCTGLTSVSIPNSVTSIDSSVFNGCTSLTNVIIPDSVTNIEGGVFYGCTSLTCMTIPNGVKTIASYMFRGCTNLITISIPAGIQSIGCCAFDNCTNLTSIKIPDVVTSIDESAFRNCTSLTSMKIPNNITYIAYETFCGCTSLGSVTIPYGVTSIAKKAFSGCTSLGSVSIPYGVTSIDESAFSGCTSLETFSIPDSVTSIGVNAFENTLWYDNQPDGLVYTGKLAYKYKGTCPSHIDIKNGTVGIVESAFKFCDKLTSISIPYGVTSIGRDAFYCCNKLMDINMPDSVISLGFDAFGETKYYRDQPDGVVYIGKFACGYKGDLNDYPENINIKNGTLGIADLAFRNGKLKSITFPEGLISIGESAFDSCSNLRSVSIPKSVTYIGDCAFGFVDLGWISNFLVYGYIGTAAQSYVERYEERYGFQFVALDQKDNEKPIVSLSSTNTVSSSQTVTISLSDNIGIKGYYWGTNSTYFNNTYTTTSSTGISKTVDSAGTYYATAVDTSGNVSSTVSITFYKTTLNANGGSVNPTSVLTKSGNPFTFPTPTRSNYSYVGWSTSSTATSGVKTLSPSSNATYYAVWSYVDSQKPTVSLSSTNNVASSQTVTISLSDNVGINGYYWGTSSTYSNNSYTTSSSTSVTKTVSASGTYYVTAVDTSGNVSDSKSITFYKTTLNANGGSVSPTSVLTKAGNSFTFPTPARSNYTYVGWSTSSSATSGAKTLSPTSSLTYYAVWKTNSSFVWGQDNWNFKNSAPTYFPSSTYRKQINNTYLNKLKTNLTNSEYQAVFEGTWYSSAWLDDWWGGSCYGMSSLTLLSKAGMLPYSSYQSGATKLHDLGYPKNNSNLNSLITYYQVLQVKGVIQQQYRTVPNKTNQENITNLINLLDKNSTVLVGFKKAGWGGHAILAIGYEYGSWTFNGVSYQGCIKICDPNASIGYNTRYNIYFNTKSYNWTIPAYSNMTSTAGAKFNYIGATVNEINKGGYLSGTSGNKVDDFVARIDAIAISNNRSVSKVENTNGVYMNQSSQPDEIVEDYSFILGNESEGTIGYNLYDANSSYKISQSNAEKLQLYMDYENCSLTGGSAAGESVIFDKSGDVEVNGESAMYNMSMTYDETYPTDWFAIQVQGYNANSASLRMVNDGYVLTADNLENVSLRANNRETYAKVAFSTEYNSVFIYEVDENTIGIRVDTDGNGTYETELPTNTFQFGDTNLDGAISISDVTAIQRHLADLSSFSDEQLTVADTNGDGQVDINDATHLQMYLAEFDVVLGKRKSK